MVHVCFDRYGAFCLLPMVIFTHWRLSFLRVESVGASFTTS